MSLIYYLFIMTYLCHTRFTPLLASVLFTLHMFAPAFVRLGINLTPPLAIAPAVPNDAPMTAPVATLPANLALSHL